MHTSLLIPVLSESTALPSPRGLPFSEHESFALAKYFSRLKSRGERLCETWPARKMLAKNIVKFSTTGTLLLVCAAEPSKLTCVTAAGAIADLAMEIVFDFAGYAVEQMENEGSLTKGEAEAVRSDLLALRGLKITVSVVLGEGVPERVIEGLDYLTLPMDDNGVVKLTVGLQKDLAGKAVKLIYILNKR